MKSLKYLLTVIILLFPVLLFSQRIWFGPKVGLNINDIEKTELAGHTFGLGLQAGGTFEYRFNKWFSLSADLLYQEKMKGYEINETSSFIKTLTNSFILFIDPTLQSYIDSLTGSLSQFMNDTIYSKTRGIIKLRYIELPVLAKFRYKGFSLSAGPYVAILLSNIAKEEFSQDIPLLKTIQPALDTIPFLPEMIGLMFPGNGKPVIADNKTNNDVKMFDYGFIVDLSYQASSNLIFGLRYSRGIPNYRFPELKKNDYLSSISFSIGYLLNPGKNKLSNPLY